MPKAGVKLTSMVGSTWGNKPKPKAAGKRPGREETGDVKRSIIRRTGTPSPYSPKKKSSGGRSYEGSAEESKKPKAKPKAAKSKSTRRGQSPSTTGPRSPAETGRSKLAKLTAMINKSDTPAAEKKAMIKSITQRYQKTQYAQD